MVDIEYKGYNFNQTRDSDRYRIFDSDGKMVALEYEKPNMTVSEGMMAIERYILISRLVREWVRA